MKIITAIAFLTLTAASQAAIPINLPDFEQIYGAPDKTKDRPMPGPAQLTFTSDDVTIHVQARGDAILGIQYECHSALNELEIGLLLKQLSPNEEWKSSTSGNWILPKAKTKAHWDGGRTMTVQ